MVPRENKNNAYAKFWRTNKEYYGIFESGPFEGKKFCCRSQMTNGYIYEKLGPEKSGFEKSG